MPENSKAQIQNSSFAEYPNDSPLQPKSPDFDFLPYIEDLLIHYMRTQNLCAEEEKKIRKET